MFRKIRVFANARSGCIGISQNHGIFENDFAKLNFSQTHANSRPGLWKLGHPLLLSSRGTGYDLIGGEAPFIFNQLSCVPKKPNYDFQVHTVTHTKSLYIANPHC